MSPSGTCDWPYSDWGETWRYSLGGVDAGVDWRWTPLLKLVLLPRRLDSSLSEALRHRELFPDSCDADSCDASAERLGGVQIMISLQLSSDGKIIIKIRLLY